MVLHAMPRLETARDRVYGRHPPMNPPVDDEISGFAKFGRQRVEAHFFDALV
jgi:hypothetical protein